MLGHHHQPQEVPRVQVPLSENIPEIAIEIVFWRAILNYIIQIQPSRILPSNVIMEISFGVHPTCIKSR